MLLRAQIEAQALISWVGSLVLMQTADVKQPDAVDYSLHGLGQGARDAD